HMVSRRDDDPQDDSPPGPPEEPSAVLSPSQQIAAALKRERLRAGLSLSEVARRAGIGKSTMSGLETGTGNPSLETMWALAAALDIPLARLLDPPPHEVALQHVGDMPSLPSTTANYVATLLAPSPTNARRDVYFIQAEPGETKRSQPHPQGTIEHVILGRGAARIEVLGQSYERGVGDYLTHPGDQPHHFTALAPGTNAVFVVESSWSGGRTGQTGGRPSQTPSDRRRLFGDRAFVGVLGVGGQGRQSRLGFVPRQSRGLEQVDGDGPQEQDEGFVVDVPVGLRPRIEGSRGFGQGRLGEGSVGSATQGDLELLGTVGQRSDVIGDDRLLDTEFGHAHDPAGDHPHGPHRPV